MRRATATVPFTKVLRSSNLKLSERWIERCKHSQGAAIYQPRVEFSTKKGLILCPKCRKPMTLSQSSQAVNGSSMYICRSCSPQVNYTVPGVSKETSYKKPSSNLGPTPHEIFEDLNKYVVGQEWVKKVLSVAVHNHYKVVFFNNLLQEKSELEEYLEQKESSRRGIKSKETRKASESQTWYQSQLNNPNKETKIELDGKEILAHSEEHLSDEEYWDEFEDSLETKDEEVLRNVLSLSKKNEIDVNGLDKSNVLLLGPTGSGKTLMAQTLAKIANVPLAIFDATSLTQAGYVGDDVENILVNLYQAANGDLKKAERGIVYIDEIDKLARVAGPSMGAQRDVSGEGVQQALLKILEGSVCNIPTKPGAKARSGEMIKFNTRNVLFICGGAFAGLERVINSRSTETGLGFGAKVNEKFEAQEEKKTSDLLLNVEAKDLVSFGLIPEFVGRFTHVVATSQLSIDQLVSILTEPKNSLVKQYKTLFALNNVEFEIETEALEAVAQAAKNRGTGARGLKSILEKSLVDTMFHLPQSSNVEKVLVTKAAIQGKEAPTLIYREEEDKSEPGNIASAI